MFNKYEKTLLFDNSILVNMKDIHFICITGSFVILKCKGYVLQYVADVLAMDII